MKFIDRKRELRALSSFYRTQGAGLFILFGRRRVGKTSFFSHSPSRRIARSRLRLTLPLANCALFLVKGNAQQDNLFTAGTVGLVVLFFLGLLRLEGKAGGH
jgi:hypothetical protein